ncbi:unnamed protein product [Danaus chrysippus]|uniref:unspecific monooxygenase n=1 Tax=Danaus chrysippus TaxID=151541 RepID=A0A8J2VV19_9NEOP|nr:unnamed protein product [Danaus chrysippus]
MNSAELRTMNAQEFNNAGPVIVPQSFENIPRMSILFLLFSLTTCFSAYLILRWNKVKNYWAERGVPHSPPNPFLGSLTFMQRKNVGIWMREMYEQFKSPYIGIWLIWKPALIINDPDIARRILVKDNTIFRDRYLSSGSTDPIGGLNIFTINDPDWSNIRRKLTNLFTAAKLRFVQAFALVKAKELVQRVDRDRNKSLELKTLFVDYTTDVIGTFAFGLESNATLTSKGPLRKVTDDFMRFSVYRGLCWFSIFFWPDLVDIFRFSLFPKESTDYFKKIYLNIMDQRLKHPGSKQYKDLVDALIEIRKESEEKNQNYPDDLYLAQAAIVLLGGFDSTASALTYMTYELAHDSERQEKLYKELKEAESKSGANFDAQTLTDLTYLNCVFKEILRKYAPMGWLDRIASTDYNIDENLTIPAGTVIYVNAIGMHHDPKYFPEPYKFNPDRFLPENEGNIEPYTYMPFGDGPRVCIGQRFAYMSARTAAAQLFLKYKVKPIPGAPKPKDVKVESKGLFLGPGEPVYVEFIPRTECE